LTLTLPPILPKTPTIALKIALAAALSTALGGLGGAAIADDRLPMDMECEVNPACLEATLAREALAKSLVVRERSPSRAAIVYAELPPSERLRLQAVHQPSSVANAAPAASPAQPSSDAIAALIEQRDASMFQTLTTQSLASIVAGGLDNDGETTSAERQAAEAFYAQREHQPVFIEAGVLNQRGQALLELFQNADVYGLNPVDFENPAFLAPNEVAQDAMQAARSDIGMTLWAIRYARHATTGRVNPASIASDITMERNFVDPSTVMTSLLASQDLSQALLAYHPPHAQFHALRQELANLRERDALQTVELIAEGGTIRLGDSDPRVPQLRARLGLEPRLQPDPISTASVARPEIQLANASAEDTPIIDAPVIPETEPFDPNLVDEALDGAIKTFQAEHNLTPDGIVGPATFAALNEQAGDLVPHIIANMERWRWMPRDLGDFHVIANVPEYRLWVRQDGETTFTTRTVVGRNQNRTAIFSDEMEYMAVNPYWNVPSSIARGEILPRLLQDPGYASRGNYEVIYNGNVVDPFAINWQAAAQQGMPRIRQRPGARNALGEIKFMFPNQHAIYFHDTPSRGLFSRDQRAFSHGCVRVLDPWAFAGALLENEPDWDLARARSLQGPRERNLILDRHIPVHITYFTARVDDDGRLIMARDLYGHHGRVLAALGLQSS
jgi:murein L,D-transpeptidase YcbB/YkuD